MKQFIIRRDTDENWKKHNPILKYKELIYITDLKKYKMGDGNSSYNDLNFIDKIDLNDIDSIILTIGEFVITIK